MKLSDVPTRSQHDKATLLLAQQIVTELEKLERSAFARVYLEFMLRIFSINLDDASVILNLFRNKSLK